MLWWKIHPLRKSVHIIPLRTYLRKKKKIANFPNVQNRVQGESDSVSTATMDHMSIVQLRKILNSVNEHMHHCTSIQHRYALHIYNQIQVNVVGKEERRNGNQEKIHASIYAKRTHTRTLRAAVRSFFQRTLVGQMCYTQKTHTHYTLRENAYTRARIVIWEKILIFVASCDMRTTSVVSIFANVRIHVEKIARLKQIIMRFIISEQFSVSMLGAQSIARLCQRLCAWEECVMCSISSHAFWHFHFFHSFYPFASSRNCI